MPAVFSLTIAAAKPALRASVVLARIVSSAFSRLVRVIRNRRDATKLVNLDDRMLADIGLTRRDLRDAFAEPLWHDPTDVLAQRHAERRYSRWRAAFEHSVANAHEPGCGLATPSYPSADRPVHYLI